MLLVAHFLNFATAFENPDVGTFFRKHSKVGVYAPLIFNIRLIAITVLLFVYHVTPTLISYFIVIVQVGYLAFILFGRPHKKPFDLMRSICVEVGLLYIFAMRFVEVNVLSNYIEFDSNMYPLLAYV